MIYNSRKAKEIDVNGVKFLVKPFTVLQQAEFAEILNSNDGDKNHLHAIYNSMEYLLNNIVENIVGLKDYEGSEVDFKSVNKRELAEGLKIEDIIDVTNAISEVNRLLDADKKKLLSQAESGTGS
ncbi:MAG: hypothetical protein LBQ76_04795 [Candidatus Fibromonas sp.]|jgi:hypothetical protein|nr:hypothetical protein [Candidatus Fibromonas sp.]